MITEPDRYVQDFAAAGADWITVHVEACTHLHRTIHHIKDLGKKAGAVLNPATSLATLDYILPDLDLVMLMGVNPGFGGQSFIESTPGKIRKLRRLLKDIDSPAGIEIDGGVGPGTIARIAGAGANIFVAGSAVFGRPDYRAVIKEMKQLAGF